MAHSKKRCKQCHTALKICEKHNRLWCQKCSIDCTACITEVVERGDCPKCWGKLSKCDSGHKTIHYCPTCDMLPNSPRSGCPVCRSKESKVSIDARCSKCKEIKSYCTTHGKIWCTACDGNACLACEAALAPLMKMGINDRCRHDQKSKLCKICEEEKEKSGKIPHHCGQLMAYCGTHKCYVCPMCDITSKCLGEPGFCDLVECEGDPQQVHWDWESFEQFQDNKQLIYQALMTMVTGWPALKEYIRNYIQLQAMSQPQASEDAYAELAYFEDAIKDIKVGFAGTKLDEAAEHLGYDEHDNDNDGDDFEDNRYDDRRDEEDEYYGGVPHGSQRHSNDANWGMNRHKHIQDATFKVKGKVIVTVTEVSTDKDDELMSYPFKAPKGEKIPTYDACSS